MEAISINYTNLFNYPYNEEGERLCLICSKISNNRFYCAECFSKYNLNCFVCGVIIIKENIMDHTSFRHKLQKYPNRNNYCSRQCLIKPKICKHPDCDVDVSTLETRSLSKYCSKICKQTNYEKQRSSYAIEDLHFCEHCKRPFPTRASKISVECPRCLEETRLNLTKNDI